MISTLRRRHRRLVMLMLAGALLAAWALLHRPTIPVTALDIDLLPAPAITTTEATAEGDR